MKKFGKYEKMRKNAILQTYITSLLCLGLCVTMFFGTSMAWFSDTAESTQNQMYVGTLEVELKHASFKDGELGQYALIEKVADEDNPIIDANIKWEPGYTAVEKFELIEKGDLAFSYQMGIECEFVDTKDTEGKVTTSADAKKAIASAITVWNYTGANAKEYALPADFDVMTAENWEPVGTLLDVITKHLPIFEGEMNKDAVTAEAEAKAYHLIALHMEESFSDSAVQGKTLDGITVKLVATQKHSEQDAFANPYDEIVRVRTEEELTEAIAAGKNILLNNDIELTSTLAITDATVIDLNGYALSGTCDAGQGHLIMVNYGAKLDIQDSSKAKNGKVTYAKGKSDTGWTIDLEGELNLYSGAIELTGENWSIGYAVDVRPNAWGSAYTEGTVFNMYGGKLVSSDGAVRVASSSEDSYPNVSANFNMYGGEIDAGWDGVFIQQSNAAYDTLNVQLNGGSITSKKAPVRFYGPNATSVNSGAEKPMTLTVGSDMVLTFSGSANADDTWYENNKIMYGGGMSLENLNKYATIEIQ